MILIEDCTVLTEAQYEAVPLYCQAHDSSHVYNKVKKK